LLGTIILWQTGWVNDVGIVKTFVLVYSIAISALFSLSVFAYVKSHRYIITNLRIIFKGGIIKKRERTLRYDKITDVDGEQGILGQIFGFGTIIPITQSGFGLGSDQTFAAGGVEAQSKKIGIFGFAGGSKEVKTPRTRSYYELHGVYPYREIRKLVEEFIQGNVITPYQKEQVELQREQVELQKEMKEFLEKQSLLKDDE
ncbi:MAG TPA: PH domain-containing protein, partial [Thermoplasmatales archaeon]|nr:PH domain-containing protein [Thermoplasmatales archaeon]